MGLLHDIQKELLDAGSQIGPTLLKLRYLASKLGSDVLEEWVKHETEGYPSSVTVPDYRIASVNYSGTFTDGFRTLSNVPIPHATIRSVANESWLKYPIRDAIAVIDKLVATEGSDRGSRMGINAADLAPRLYGKVYEGMGLVDIRATFGGSPYSHIHNLVRAKILDLTIALDKQVPIASTIDIGSSGSEIDAADAGKTAQITQYVIYGDQNNITNSASGSATITVNVVAGDYVGLVDYLKSVGVAEQDAKELAAIAADERPESAEQPMSERAKGWLAKVLGEAWGVSKEVGTQLLTEGLKQYYGLP